jgi:trans-2,3-dihydro-3-hydroxyanthranilate isomerase
MITVDFVTVDVFTRSPFRGNQLAIILDAGRLDAALMQQIAREFNYSETVFLLPAGAAEHTARIRIFTPTEEIPFAGHPNVGAAYAAARIGRIFGRPVRTPIIFEEDGGPVTARPIYDGDALVGAQFDAPQRLQVLGDVDPKLVADCARLPKNQIAVGAHAPVMASIGLPFAMAEVASPAALARAKPDPACFAEADERHPAGDNRFSLFLYARTDNEPNRLRARMFAPLSNIMEDPATGSAAGALAAFLAAMPSTPDGEHNVHIEQGIEMGRPSAIAVRTIKRQGVVERIAIGGECAPVMRGVLEYE